MNDSLRGRRTALALLAATMLIATQGRPRAGEAPLLDLGSTRTKADHARLAPARSRRESRPARIEVVPPDERLRVAFLGNTFIDRAARHGYLESELTRLWPRRDIVFRSLGWPGDDITGTARTGFGPGEYRRSGWKPPDNDTRDYGFHRMLEQVAEARPDVLFIGYGSTVAFDGAPGLERFETGLKRLLDALEPAGVRVVLLSPPPREARGEGWPDPRGQNEWLERVTKLLSVTAAARGHLHVDVFHELGKLDAARPDDGTGALTDNGIHLNERGYRTLARIVAKALRLSGDRWSLRLSADGAVKEASACRVEDARRSEFGLRLRVIDERLPGLVAEAPRVLTIDGLAPGSYALDVGGRRVARGSAQAWARGVAIERGPDLERAEELRRAIVAKNRLFFYQFRPQNKAYIYLFRRHERGHHEGEVAQFRAMVREREEDISRLRRPLSQFWEIVRERDYPEHEVPGGAQPPDVATELERFRVADALEVSLFASDPMVANPINVNWDERGRLWVATSTIYPHLAPGQAPDDRILILEDLDGDGRADKSTVFADRLLVPQSVIPARGGAFVTQSTEVLFLEDVDGDDRADRRHLLLSGFGNADVHHMIHGLRWGPGGDLYFTQSIYINSWVETPWGVRQLSGSGIWRLRPRVLSLEVHSRGLVNPWGHAFDRWGQSFSTDGAGGGGPAHTFAGSAYGTAKGVPRTLPTMNPGRPKECGLEIVSGRHLPASWSGNLVTSDFRANRVVRYRLTDSGSGYTSRLLGDVLSSSHRSFRPVDVKMGPDGAIYVVDWYSPIIDHGEVDFHHPLRDHRHGRIWRLTAKGREPVEPPRLAAASTRELLDALKLPEDWTRDQARRLLRERGARDVVPELRRWLATLDARSPAARSPDARSPDAKSPDARSPDARSPEREHQRLEALRVLQGLRIVDADLLRRVLSSSDHRVRAAAFLVVADLHAALDDAGRIVAAGVTDEQPRVRLAAVGAARAIGGRRGAELALSALDRPLDRSLEHAVWTTARELESSWLPVLASGKPVFDGKPERLAFALGAVGKKASLEPLVRLVQAGEISGRERREALELIGSLGAPRELAMVLDIALAQVASDAASATALLDALGTGARRGSPPPASAQRILEALSADDARVVDVAARLAGDWRVAQALPVLTRVLGDPTASPPLRHTAGLAIARLDAGSETLSRLSEAAEDVSVRVTATAALATIDAGRAAPIAAALLAAAGDAARVELLFDAFVGLKGGDELLATALDGSTLESQVAATGVRIAGSSGRDMKRLVAELTRAGSLQPVTTMPAPAELTALLRSVAAQGDPARGEAVFRRDTLRCVTCHAVGGAGGKVGPDLSSLGGSSQLVHIVESLLEPSAKMKEGYEPVVVIDRGGAIHSGTVTRRADDGIELRDAKDRVVFVPAGRIQAVTGSDVSIMPTGLAQTLRRDELVDLVRFLSELGRPGPYTLPTGRFVRTWRVLEPTATAAAALAAGDDALVSGSGSLSWKTCYSRVDGSLPTAELPAASAAGARVVQFTVDEERPTTIDIGHATAAPSGAVLWVNGRRRTIAPDGTAALRKGASRCTLLLESATGALRVELRDR